MPQFGEPGSRIGYTVYEGPPGAPPVYLLHGFTASAAAFLPNIPDLAERFTVVTVELLGHGQSEAPEDPARYTPEAAIARLLALMDALGHERILLCGHSLGGAVALRLALEAPARLAGLIVINSNSAAGTPAWREESREGLQRMAARARAEGTAFLRDTRLYPARGSRLPQAARDALAQDFERIPPHAFAATAEALVAGVNAYERLPDLRVPILIVSGTRDAAFLANLPGFRARLPRRLVQEVSIPGGHAVNLEQPAAFLAAVLGFARQVGYVPGPPPPRDLPGTIIRSAGLVLIVIGAGLSLFAFYKDGKLPLPLRGDGDSAAATLPTRPPAATPTRPPATPSPATASSSPSPSPSPAATTAGAATPTQTPSPTPLPASPTPAAPAPGSARVSISGPRTADPLVPVVYSDSSPEQSNIITRTWSYPGGEARHLSSIPVQFSSPGCYTVSLTIFTASGAESDSILVAVGEATCNSR